MAYQYIHFSSRPEAPAVPPRSINRFAGGSGPLGVYAYQTDARMTFASERPYAFLLTPTVPVTYTNKYGAADLERDLAKLAELADIKRPLRLYERWLDEAARPGPPFHKLWYVISRIPRPDADPEDMLGWSGEGFADPRGGRDLFIKLGHRVIDDRYGIMYGSEPQQAVFLTDDSFVAEAVDPAVYRRNPTDPTSKSDEKIDEIMDLLGLENRRWKEERKRGMQEIAAAFASAHAIRGKASYGPEERMAILSGELSDHKYGKHRVTFFGPDGPHGHVTRDSLERIYEDVLDSMKGPYTPMSDDEVMAWTSSPAFEYGSRVIAFVQADNTLRWFASKAGRDEWARGVVQRANDVGTRDGTVNSRGKPHDLAALDEALDIMHAAIRELPVPNPGRALVRNPPWVTGTLADHYQLLHDAVPPRWLPQLASVTHHRRKMVAELVEFGCGAYGCVIATNDPSTVLKVTTDDTEAEFAAKLAPDLAAPICVEYRQVVRLNAKHEKRTIYLLWREAAQLVGDIESVSRRAVALISRQHIAAQKAYSAIRAGDHPRVVRPLLEKWEHAAAAMADDPVLRPFSDGLLKVWKRQHIFFGDLHDGNLGLVIRERGAYPDEIDRGTWVITDPGHVAVVNDSALWG